MCEASKDMKIYEAINVLMDAYASEGNYGFEPKAEIEHGFYTKEQLVEILSLLNQQATTDRFANCLFEGNSIFGEADEDANVLIYSPLDDDELRDGDEGGEN